MQSAELARDASAKTDRRQSSGPVPGGAPPRRLRRRRVFAAASECNAAGAKQLRDGFKTLRMPRDDDRQRVGRQCAPRWSGKCVQDQCLFALARRSGNQYGSTFAGTGTKRAPEQARGLRNNDIEFQIADGCHVACAQVG